MGKEQAEPGSIDELFEIAALVKEKLNDDLLSQIQLLEIAAQIRANDLKQEQVEYIKDAADSFMQICAQLMAFVAQMNEKSAKTDRAESVLGTRARR